MAQQAVLKLTAENSELVRRLDQTTRKLKVLESQVNKNKHSGKGAFDPLRKSVQGTTGPLGALSGKFKSIANAGAGISGPMAGAAVGIAGVAAGLDFVGRGIDKLKKLVAQTKLLENATGMSTETSSAWVGVARRFGLSAEQLSGSLGILSKRIVGASGSSAAATKQMAIFAKAGVSPAILKSKDMDRMLVALANKFKAMPNGVTKTDLALKLFGRSGKTLIPILNQGGTKVNALKREMAALGLTISGKTKNQVTELNKAQKKLNDVWDGMQIQLAKKVIPKISEFGGALSSAVVGLKDGHKPAGQLAGDLYDIGRAAERIASGFSRIASEASKITKSKVGRALGKTLEFAAGGFGLFATGGIINRPTAAVVGEDGPEAIIPLSGKHRARGASLYAQAGAAMGFGGQASSGHTFNIYNTGSLDENALAARMAWQIQTRNA